MSKEMLIKNGIVVFETDVRKADILIKDEKIAAIYESGEVPNKDCEVIDATGLYVMPGKAFCPPEPERFHVPRL